MCRIPPSQLKLSPPISPPHDDGMTSNRRSPTATMAAMGMGGATGNSVAALRDPAGQLNVHAANTAACKSQSSR